MHRGYKLHVRHVFMIALVALFVGGCEKKQDPITGPDTPPTSGGSISDEVRLATLDTLSSVFGRLPGINPAADRQTVLSYLKSRPEFEAAGISSKGENVWGRFIDGRLFLFVNNRQPSSVVAGSLVFALAWSGSLVFRARRIELGASVVHRSFLLMARRVLRVRPLIVRTRVMTSVAASPFSHQVHQPRTSRQRLK